MTPEVNRGPVDTCTGMCTHIHTHTQAHIHSNVFTQMHGYHTQKRRKERGKRERRRRRRKEGSFQGYGTVKKWELETRADEATLGHHPSSAPARPPVARGEMTCKSLIAFYVINAGRPSFFLFSSFVGSLNLNLTSLVRLTAQQAPWILLFLPPALGF